MYHRSILAGCVAAMALGACAPAPEREREIRAPAIVALGETRSCISTDRIRDTRVEDDFTIDFEMVDGTIYRNTLPNRCYSLGFEERFAHSSTTGQLCDIDTVTVLLSNGSRGSTCALGNFLPVRYVEED